MPVQQTAGARPLRLAGHRHGTGVPDTRPAVDVTGRHRLADARPRPPSGAGGLSAAAHARFIGAGVQRRFSLPTCSSLPADLPDDPATLQLILRAALAEIERLRLMIAGLHATGSPAGRRSSTTRHCSMGWRIWNSPWPSRWPDWRQRRSRRRTDRPGPRPHPPPNR